MQRGISLIPSFPRHSPLPPQKQLSSRAKRGICFFLRTFQLSAPNLQLSSSPPSRSSTAPRLPINMHLPIHYHRHIFPPLQKLHHLPTLPRHPRPSRLGLRILLQPAQFPLLEAEIHLFQFALRCLSDRVSFALKLNGFSISLLLATLPRPAQS